MTPSLRVKLSFAIFGALAILLLIGSLQTGERRYGDYRRLLADAASLNNRIDIAVLSIQTHIRGDYDTVSELQRSIRKTLASLREHPEDEVIARAVDSKLELIEQYKSRHAVFRNSLRIIPELEHALKESMGDSGVNSTITSAIQTLEWAVFRDAYVGWESDYLPVSDALSLVQQHPEYATIGDGDEWGYLLAHIQNVRTTAPETNRLFDAIMSAPVERLIEEARQRIQGGYERLQGRSQIFLLVLFAMTIALLAVALQKIIVVWRYKTELERRVENRTRELEDANARLREEMDAKASMQQELIQAQKLESIGQLSAGIAHEINTPTQYVGDNIRFLQDSLSDILGFVQGIGGLARGNDAISPEQLQSCLDAADMAFLEHEIPRAISESSEGISRVTTIVRALKEFSHQSKEKVTENLNRAIESTATVATNEWKYVADLKCEFDDELPPVPCILGEFNQVVLNMIINAAHAVADVVGKSGEKGQITLRTKLRGDYAEVTVSDTGTGIPEDRQTRIFDPFYTTKEVGKGTGQGLFIAHNVIVDKHGGTLSVSSEPGKGSCFTIRLPIAEPERGRTDAAAA